MVSSLNLNSSISLLTQWIPRSPKSSRCAAQQGGGDATAGCGEHLANLSSPGMLHMRQTWKDPRELQHVNMHSLCVKTECLLATSLQGEKDRTKLRETVFCAQAIEITQLHQNYDDTKALAITLHGKTLIVMKENVMKAKVKESPQGEKTCGWWSLCGGSPPQERMHEGDATETVLLPVAQWITALVMISVLLMNVTLRRLMQCAAILIWFLPVTTFYCRVTVELDVTTVQPQIAIYGRIKSTHMQAMWSDTSYAYLCGMIICAKMVCLNFCVTGTVRLLFRCITLYAYSQRPTWRPLVWSASFYFAAFYFGLLGCRMLHFILILYAFSASTAMYKYFQRPSWRPPLWFTAPKVPDLEGPEAGSPPREFKQMQPPQHMHPDKNLF